jgi:hypothetical protein
LQALSVTYSTLKATLLQHTVFLLADFPNDYAPTLALPIYYKIISTMFPPLPALQFLIDIDFLLFSKRTLPLTLQSLFSITFLKFLPNPILIYPKILQFRMPESPPSISTSTSLTFSTQTLPTSASTSHRYPTLLSLLPFPLKLNFRKLAKCPKAPPPFPVHLSPRSPRYLPFPTNMFQSQLKSKPHFC